MRRFLSLTIAILAYSNVFYGNEKLKECLETCWGVDRYTTQFLCNYFRNENGEKLVEAFICESMKLNIQFPADKQLKPLSSDDGVLLATKFHPVVFESPYVRILAGCAEPGEREPFHTHVWRSLLVLFDEATYFVEYGDGRSEWLELKAGVYPLSPEDLYACTNCGTKKEQCLRFEVKD